MEPLFIMGSHFFNNLISTHLLTWLITSAIVASDGTCYSSSRTINRNEMGILKLTNKRRELYEYFQVYTEIHGSRAEL